MRLRLPPLSMIPHSIKVSCKGDNWLKSFIASVHKHLPILPAHIVSPHVCPRCLPTLSAHQIYLNLSLHSIRPFCFIWSSHISNSISHCVTRPCIVAVSRNGCKSLRLTDNESEEEGWCIEPSSGPELVVSPFAFICLLYLSRLVPRDCLLIELKLS